MFNKYIFFKKKGLYKYKCILAFYNLKMIINSVHRILKEKMQSDLESNLVQVVQSIVFIKSHVTRSRFYYIVSGKNIQIYVDIYLFQKEEEWLPNINFFGLLRQIQMQMVTVYATCCRYTYTLQSNDHKYAHHTHISTQYVIVKIHFQNCQKQSALPTYYTI